MPLSPRDFALHFSGHDFEPTFAQVSSAVLWRMPGAEALKGRAALIEACRSTAASLIGVDVRQRRLLLVDGGDRVVVDTVTDYRHASGTTTVASCDIYEFQASELVALTSYTVEV